MFQDINKKDKFFKKFIQKVTFVSYLPFARGNALSRIIDAHEEYFWVNSQSGYKDKKEIVYDSLCFTEYEEGQFSSFIDKNKGNYFKTIVHNPKFFQFGSFGIYLKESNHLKKQYEKYINNTNDKRNFIDLIKSNKKYSLCCHASLEYLIKEFPNNKIINFWCDKKTFIKEARSHTNYANFKSEYYYKPYELKNNNIGNINKNKIFSEDWDIYSKEFDKLSNFLEFKNPRKNACRAFILAYLERNKIFKEYDRKLFKVPTQHLNPYD